MGVPARIHAILARKGDSAIVFRRGPSNKVAVIGWDRQHDTFTPGQWLYGRIYEYRCDLSPNGEYLIYFAAKYGNASPVEIKTEAYLREKLGGDWWRMKDGSRKRDLALEEIQREHAAEFAGMIAGRDYHDRSWTAISRAPYLKALDLWWNGTGWNGGGLFLDDKEICLNHPPKRLSESLRGMDSHKFREVPPPAWCEYWGYAGECPMVYLPRLKRDGWTILKEHAGGWLGEKVLPGDIRLQKDFYCSGADKEPGYGCYYERHAIRDSAGNLLLDGANWRWADYDARRKRIVFAEHGAIYAWNSKDLERAPVLLCDFNDMKYERIAAPY